jgi:hypothetical protein
VTSAFIIQVHPQLQQDPTDETAALLRVILYNMNNTAFGGNIPSLPQWTGPPRVMIQVQAMLYASFAASLLSALLAMLGKQWLNRYASTDMRGTGIERSQDRQRKLYGIVTWYFDHVMESLPLMLQFALLLLGCALSLYLWGIDVTVAWVVVGVTVLGVTLYVFFVIAGAASASCPYQTPGARILRHIHYLILPHILYTLPNILGSLPSAFRDLIRESKCLVLFSANEWYEWHYWTQNVSVLLMYILSFPCRLAYDVYQLTLEMVVVLIVLAFKVWSWLRRMRGWIRNARFARARQLNQRVAMLDSRCISWILQTSLEKGIRLTTLKFLTTTPTLADFTPTLVSDCFGIFIDCIKISKRSPVVVQGMEQLAETSTMCFFLAYSHLSTIDPMPSVLVDIHQHYRRIFPPDLDFSGLPFHYTLGIIHEAIHSRKPETPIEWRDYKPTNREHVAVARALSKLSWSEYQRSEYQRSERNMVPRQCLCFVSHSLFQDSLPPPIIADCLLIIAIDLGCNVSNTMVSGERYAHTWRISITLLTNGQCTT